MKMIVLGFGCS
uniref:Uncharacterized protein n=1 Tax=Rhizophora mucronata TaxID=61149 RepID=A0A2P2PN95_RHIMU